MPIDYGPSTAWPPAEVQRAGEYYREWLAWWRGDTSELFKIYSAAYGGELMPPPSIRRDGLRGVLTKFWAGRSVTNVTRSHVPAAADVATISSGLLFADPPTISVPKPTRSRTEPGTPALVTPPDPLQERLDKILIEAGVYNLLKRAAQEGSAAGGIYLRASANTALADMPIGESILPDTAVPEFYGPFLSAVTFWRVISDEGVTPVVRHLERHEMEQGVCVVYHAAFEGSRDRLGRRVPLPEPYASMVDEGGRVVIGTSLLDVVYVPTVQPHHDPLLGHTQLGRSDFADCTVQLDQLDETWSSWMRDIRLGKGRLVVPRAYVKRYADGDGAGFDLEQEVYSAVNAQIAGEGNALAITASQFAIRVAEHQQTADQLLKIIFRAAGLDGNEGQTDVSPETATATNAKTSRKRSTRAAKIGFWTPALERFSKVLLQLDQLYYRGRPAPTDITIEWPDAAAPDMETLARTIQLLDAAGAVSQRTKVAMLHPDWDDDQVDAEVILIQKGAPAAPDEPLDTPAPELGADDPQAVGEPVDGGSGEDPV